MRHFTVTIIDKSDWVHCISIWASQIQRVPGHVEMLRLFVDEGKHEHAVAVFTIQPGLTIKEWRDGHLVSVAELE